MPLMPCSVAYLYLQGRVATTITGSESALSRKAIVLSTGSGLACVYIALEEMLEETLKETGNTGEYSILPPQLVMF